jgi:hypothetical protein
MPAVMDQSGISCEVECIRESWRVDDEWWRLTISRRYFEVTLKSGKRVVLFQDLSTQEWYVQQP